MSANDALLVLVVLGMIALASFGYPWFILLFLALGFIVSEYSEPSIKDER